MSTFTTHQCDCCKKIYTPEELKEVGMQTLKWDLQWKAGNKSDANYVKAATHIDLCFPCLEKKGLLRPKEIPGGQLPPDYLQILSDSLMRILEDRIADLIKEHLPNQ